MIQRLKSDIDIDHEIGALEYLGLKHSQSEPDPANPNEKLVKLKQIVCRDDWEGCYLLASLHCRRYHAVHLYQHYVIMFRIHTLPELNL